MKPNAEISKQNMAIIGRMVAQSNAAKTKPTHGGRRANSGRPKLGKVQMLIWVKPETRATLKAMPQAAGVTVDQWAAR